MPGPTGGILIQTTTGAMISVSDVGIVISNGKGAVINIAGGTDERRQLGALDDDLARRGMPAYVLHLGATVACAHKTPSAGDAAGADSRACACRPGRWSR